jgi:predicted DCC family thiol-disulfide oxidoreductase YuxK
MTRLYLNLLRIGIGALSLSKIWLWLFHNYPENTLAGNIAGILERKFPFFIYPYLVFFFLSPFLLIATSSLFIYGKKVRLCSLILLFGWLGSLESLFPPLRGDLIIGATLFGIFLTSPYSSNTTQEERAKTKTLNNVAWILVAVHSFFSLCYFLWFSVTHGEIIYLGAIIHVITLVLIIISIFPFFRPFGLSAIILSDLSLYFSLYFQDFVLPSWLLILSLSRTLMIFLCLFDQSWIRSILKGQKSTKEKGSNPILFFDGECVMCSIFARLVMALDDDGSLKLAPLQGETFIKTVPDKIRSSLPDSIIIYTDKGEILSRSNAVIYTGRALGGLATIIVSPLYLIPKVARDLCYDLVAKIRYKISPRQKILCELIPPRERERLLP